MPVVATWCPADAALDIILPLGLAVAAGTCLVVDLDPAGPAIGSGPTLADLAADGPERRHLEPRVREAGFLANGGIEPGAAADVVGALVERWPAVVLRCDSRAARPDGAIGVAPLLPEPHLRLLRAPAIYQRCGMSPRTPPDGVVLPRIPRRTAAQLLAGRRPPRSSRWIRSLVPIWRAHA
jgi:hypothetical protein